MSEDERRQAVTLPRRAWLAAGGFAAAMLLILGAMVVIQSHQLSTIRDQQRMQRGLTRSQLPVLRDARDRLPQTREVGDRAQEVLRDSGPLAEELRRAPLGETVTALRRLLSDPRAEDLLVASLTTLDRADRALREMENTGAIDALARGTRKLPGMAGTLRESLSVQRRTLSLAERSYRLQLELMAVQREALRHVRNIDRKTGGPPPVAGDR